jgi:hypothetical protein
MTIPDMLDLIHSIDKSRFLLDLLSRVADSERDAALAEGLIAVNDRLLSIEKRLEVEKDRLVCGERIWLSSDDFEEGSCI